MQASGRTTMLELNKLTEQVAEMALALAGQRTRLQSLTEQARQTLQEHAQVTDELRAKLQRATEVDSSWRGADPLGDRLDACHSLSSAPEPATLLSSDGSQIYPDTHSIALYFLLNVGAIVLRQGSGEAPTTITRSQVYFDERDLYDDTERLIETDQVNARRDLWELSLLADLAVEERRSLGGDLDRLLVALGDGPLLLWMPQRLTDTQQAQRVEEFSRELDALRRVQAAPLGYVDRPRSANVLRLLQLADVPLEQITTQRLRINAFRGLSDRLLFSNLLGPGQRTGWFAATSEINDTYGRQGHRIHFCYLNVAVDEGRDAARIVRVEAPEWIVGDEDRVDAALAAVWADSQLTGYPYVLARAHELAVVSRHERGAFEQMLRVEMMRQQLLVEESAKQQQKGFLGRSR
jgi:hypothetical protein